MADMFELPDPWPPGERWPEDCKRGFQTRTLRASGVPLLASAVTNTCTASKVQRWTAQIIQGDG